jgi:WS/DGAT/MGAT family acyltransferase
MQQLTGMDASFLYLETPTMPMHISSLAIYDQSTAPGGKVRFKQIIDHTSERIKRLPILSKTLVTVPLGLDHPYWVSDGTFDPEFHIRHIALPKPGDWRQLCILISRLHARPLDRSRPLWEMYVIEGLDDVEGYPKGAFAIFTKMHHAAVDGASGMEIAATVNELTPDAPQSTEPYPIRVDSRPGTLELLARAQINTIKQPFRFISVARNTIPGVAKMVAGLRSGDLRRVTDLPRTRFNGKVSAYRVFDAVTFPLADIKAIKNSLEGVTVNDVAIAIVGGALRKYLDSKGELPDKSLAAMVPINVRSDSEKGTGGNVVSQMTVEICSHVDDPLERLKAVNAGTRSAKELTNAVGAKTMTDYTQFIPSTLTAQAARLSSRWGLMNQMKPLYNCIITNVPGPSVPLYNTGAKMLSNFGTGPVMDGVGLFQVISSYCGDFTISITSCREMMPDPAFYVACLKDSFDELKSACKVLSSKVPATKGERRGRPKARVKAKRKAKPRKKAV